MSADFTPMMRQYLDIKSLHRDAILFFRLGDFYEMFFDDAVEAAKILHITLTSRGTLKNRKVPMCGIPYHAADNYIARLIKNSKKVAICEQVEEPSPGKGIVRREVIKIITPGTFVADGLLDSAVNNYILALNPRDSNFGIAYADISTGEFRVTELRSVEDFFSELYKISPTECLIPERYSKGPLFNNFKDVNLGSVTINEDWMFDSDLSLREIRDHFSVESLEGFGCGELHLAIGAAGALLRYLKNTQKLRLDNIDVISTYSSDHFMAMDRNSHRHLELIQNQEDLSNKGTLLEVLDHTKTPMAKRKLKKWILNPLLNIGQIQNRLNLVQYFYDNSSCRIEARALLDDIYDIERLSNKVSLGTANARDMKALALSLESVKKMSSIFREDVPEPLKEIILELAGFENMTALINNCLCDEPPITLKDGGLIKEGYNPEIDELKKLVTGGKDWILNLQKKEIARSGINSLKVGYNKVFGYYIEVTNSKLNAIPDNYIRKQTLVNAERFVTQELKEEESRIIGAEDRLKNLEYEEFCRLRGQIGSGIERFKKVADNIAELDVLSNLAEIAVKNRYCRPKINLSGGINIKDGRHPVLEKLLKDKEFVPNSVNMDNYTGRIFIITGSNMAGKSTFIRQCALITIMAQMGSFVPADFCELGIVDRIFTRVGASDRLYRGMSTFMVEMLETANILNNATNKSMIILDEVGRGTSTFDGVSIAWAVVEFIHNKIPCAKTMFATHYHELTEISSVMNGVRNYHLAIRQWEGQVVFLYKVTEGSCDESFGIHIAKLAGMPDEVIKRARGILRNLQKDSLLGNIHLRFLDENKTGETLVNLFESKAGLEHPIVKEIRELEINQLTPLEALAKLAKLKETVK
ncbi:MAG: DNA mismatch repair protein MutS [Candidatus Omnitrophota bacterium]